MIEGTLNNLFTDFEQGISFPLPSPRQQLIEYVNLYKIGEEILKGIKVKSLRIKHGMRNFTDEVQLKTHKQCLAGDKHRPAQWELNQP